MIRVDRIIKALKQDIPVDRTIVHDFVSMCKNITMDIDTSVAKQNESKFEEFVTEMYIDDEIAELKKFCSPDELALFLRGME